MRRRHSHVSMKSPKVTELQNCMSKIHCEVACCGAPSETHKTGFPAAQVMPIARQVRQYSPVRHRAWQPVHQCQLHCDGKVVAKGNELSRTNVLRTRTSWLQYLNILAASIWTSHTSCSSRIMQPTRVKLRRIRKHESDHLQKIDMFRDGDAASQT